MRLRPCVLLTCLLLSTCAASVQASEPPDAVVQAAVDGLPSLLNAIPESSLDRFGFASTDQFARCEPGAFLPLRILPPDAVKAAAAGAPPSYDDPKQWLAVVTADGRPRAVLTVAWHRGAWRAVDLGALGLAVALQEALETVRSVDPAVVQVLQAGAVFLQPDRGDAARLVPLAGTGALVARPDGEPTADLRAMMQRLQTVVETNLESHPAPGAR